MRTRRLRAVARHVCSCRDAPCAAAAAAAGEQPKLRQLPNAEHGSEISSVPVLFGKPTREAAEASPAVTRAMQNVYPRTDLPEGTRLRILFGASRGSQTLIPYRVSIYDDTVHRVTVALTDQGRYVTALEPPRIEFTEEDTEEVNVGNLPTIYRSIWETGRKHGLDDATIDRIAAMYAYDLDLTRRVSPGDSIEILLSGTVEEDNQDLLYVALTLSNTTRELFRFQTQDGVIDFYNPDGETGKQFLLRRPLEGGGTLRSRYGYRRHPVKN